MSNQPEHRIFPRGVTHKNHDSVRDGILENLLSLGIEVYGDWDDYYLRKTGASRAQQYGSERTLNYDRDFDWWMCYEGDNKMAIELFGKPEHELFGSRELATACALPGMTTKNITLSPDYPRGSYQFLGFELLPSDDQPADVDPMAVANLILKPKTKNKRFFTYRCAKCGYEWEYNKALKYENQHKVDGGLLVLTKNELRQVPA